MPPPPHVAVVLPPRETFAPAGTGAIGLLVHRLATVPGTFRPVIYGADVAQPFADVTFRPVHPPWLPAGQARRYAAGVARLLAARPPALVEVHNRPDVALYLAARFPAVPVTLFLHNDPHGMRRARTPAERAALAGKLAGVVTVSDWLRSRLAQGVGVVTVLPNCIDLRALPVAVAPRDRTILFAGRVVADKGADSFVRACAQALPALPGWEAMVIGADRFGPRSPETPFLRALRPEAAAGGVTLAGWRPHPDVLAAMARAAIVVVPSRWPEPFGLTALEAMACGAAVLCAPRGGLPEVVGDAAIAIDPDDPAVLGAAIVALANDPLRRAALGAAGQARARRFDLPPAAAALEAWRWATLAAWPRAGTRPI